ncbi:MalY/PatB family protein [Gallicola sp. Sow4_E12]|uniref:MalY/PatB family protein n=1 Tax=Gallicola sp. Sow4_E12 TaxID=3438785 RepID=UPI003F9104B4
MKYNFDEIIDRKGTNCLKYDFASERGKPEGVLPLWIADMDFKAPDIVLERLSEIVNHGIFGYSDSKEDYFLVLKNWFEKKFGWKVKEEWLVKTPGIVFAIAAAIHAFTKEGDAVLIQQPVYYPFSETILDNKRKLVNSPLIRTGDRYEIDFEDFEEKIIQEQVKLFIFCSPHNPVGRVWEKDELKRIGEICLKHGVIVVSDEIHSDFVYPGHQHTVFASLSKEISDITITCTAPSKTFNIAGLQISNIFIENPVLREKVKKAIAQTGYSQVNQIGLAACQAAYEGGEEWLEELKEYLAGNIEYTRAFLKEHLPKITLIEPEGTYLLWLDFKAYNLTEEEREELIVNEAGLWLDSGSMFGPDGEGYERINIACPRETLKKALYQLKEVFSKY